VEAQCCAKIVPGVWVAITLPMLVVVVYASHIDSLSVLHPSIIACCQQMVLLLDAKLPTDLPVRIILYDRSLQSMQPCFRVCRRAAVRHVSSVCGSPRSPRVLGPEGMYDLHHISSRLTTHHCQVLVIGHIFSFFFSSFLSAFPTLNFCFLALVLFSLTSLISHTVSTLAGQRHITTIFTSNSISKSTEKWSDSPP
jgi:hypothetical protein